MTDMKPLVTPIINLNGNTAESLLDRLRDVLRAVDELQVVMAQANDITHGRNFQTSPDHDRLRLEAAHAWGERRQALDQLHRDVMDLAIAIQEQDRG